MLSLSRPIATALLAQAQSAPGARVCGLLFGEAGEPVAVQALRNTAENPAAGHRFDPAEFDAALAAAQAAGRELLAVFHSHPDSPPVPATNDLAASPAPDKPLLVISLNTKGVLEMRAFARDGATVSEIPLHIFF